MNQETIINELSKKLKLTKVETKRILNASLEVMSDLLAKGKSFQIQRFGTFSVTKLEKRKGFNPLIHRFMMLPPKLKTSFKPSETLKERINQNGRK